MKNSIPSARTAAQKSTKVETQHPSSHSNGNTLVVGSFSLSYNDCKYIGMMINDGFMSLIKGCYHCSQIVQVLKTSV